MLTRRLSLLAVLVASLTVPAGAAGAPEAPTPRGGEQMVKDKIAQREQQQRDRAARRDSTAERQRRKDSQKAFAKLTSGEARKLAIATFPETLTSPIWEPLPLREGEKVAEYIGEFNAAVDTPDGRQVAVSTTPMRARDENNKLAAVDLALEKKGTAFVAKNSTVDLSIGQSAGSALRLARAGVSVTPVVEADVAYEQDHGRLWSENVAPDTDQMVQPTTLGAELLWQIRSTEAPEQVRLRFNVPDGARVELDPVIKGLAGRPSGFARGIRVVKDGELITRVSAPQAFDADGEAIAAWYEVAGNDVLVQFPHREQDVKYPLLVDPQVTEYWNPGDWNNSGWQFYEDRFGGPHPFSPAIDCCGHPGLAVGAYQFATYNQNAFAHWYWYTDPKAYIAVTEMGELWHQPNGKSLSHSAVYDPAVGYVSYQAYGHGFDRGYVRHDTPNAGDNTAAAFGMTIYNGGGYMDQPAVTSMGAAALRLGDRHPPTVSAFDHSYDTSQWTKDAQAGVRIVSHDDGLGLNAFGVARTDRGDPNTQSVPDDYWLSVIANLGCDGTRRSTSPCRRDFDTSPGFPDGRLTYNLPEEGTHTIRASVHQISGGQYGDATHGQPWQVKIDRTAPSSSTITGQLAGRQDQGVNGAYTLTGTATDRWSGVRRLELLVDEASVGQSMAGVQLRTQADPGTGGGMTQPLDFDTASLAEGRHAVTVRATDGVSLTKDSDPVRVIVDRTRPAPPAISFESARENTGQVVWEAAVDPTASDGSSSGIAAYVVRSRVAGGRFGSSKTYDATTRMSENSQAYDSGVTLEFEVVAIDGAGNASDPVTVSDIVEGDLPLVSSEGALSSNNGGYVGPAAAMLAVSGDDQGSGIRQLLVKGDSGNLVAESRLSCTSEACPSELTRDLSIDFSTFAEGITSLSAMAIDGSNNAGQPEDLEFIVDRTPPPAPTAIRQIEADLLSAVIAWDEAPDADVDENTPGSGNRNARYRVRRTLLGTFSEWQSTEESFARINALPGELLTVEVQSFDGVGNASTVSTSELTVLPDALVGNATPEELEDVQATNAQLGTAEVRQTSTEDADGGTPVRDAGEQTRTEEAADDEKGGPLRPGNQRCTPNIRSVRTQDVSPQQRELRDYVPQRRRLGVRLFMLCEPLPSNVDKVIVTGALSYLVDSDNGKRTYQQIGRRHTIDFGRPNAFKAVERNGIRNFCIPEVGGKRKYVVVGVVKYIRSGATDEFRSYNTDFRKEKELVCPDAQLRRQWEAAAYTKLGRYSTDLDDGAQRKSYVQLRRVLGPQPFVPEAVRRDAWNAHHIIPTADKRARRIRALSFRCRVHPNASGNGVYLRGSGLRKAFRGARVKRRAFEQLEDYDSRTGETLHLRTYHSDTFGNTYGYIEKLTVRMGIALDEAPEGCARGLAPLVSALGSSKAALLRGNFGVEQPGH